MDEDFRPPWNGEQMFGCWTSRREWGRMLSRLTTHQTLSPRYSSWCQVPEQGNYRSTWRLGRRSVRQRGHQLPLCYFHGCFCETNIVLPAVWCVQYTINTDDGWFLGFEKWKMKKKWLYKGNRWGMLPLQNQIFTCAFVCKLALAILINLIPNLRQILEISTCPMHECLLKSVHAAVSARSQPRNTSLL